LGGGIGVCIAVTRPPLEKRFDKAAKMKRVLFVDYDREEFDFLWRGISKEKGQFELEYAASGEAALDLLGRENFEAIISATRTADMDGGTLLQTVCERHPAMVRILLANQQEMEHALRAVPVAHQFLLKPCDPTMARMAVERATNLSKILSNRMLANLVGTVKDLPVLPKTYFALRKKLQDPEVSMVELVQVVEQDVAISAKIFQLVNSAFFGLPLEVSSIKTAVSFLGVQMLQNVVLAAEVFSMISETTAPPGFSFEQLQAHSQLTAKIAVRLPAAPHTRDIAVMAALVHDVGKLVLATRSPRHFARALDEASREQVPLFAAERQLMGVTHAEVGAYLLGIWGLPSPVVEAVAHHHTAETAMPNDALDAVGIVHIANILAHETSQRAGPKAAFPTQTIDPGYLERLGITSQYQYWREMANAMANQVPAEP
jgi:HD-like signal output (HDOD) protein